MPVKSEAKRPRRHCRVCGGDGWTPSMGEYKASQPMSAPHPNNDCVFCAGTGWVHVDDGTAVTADELEGENW